MHRARVYEYQATTLFATPSSHQMMIRYSLVRHSDRYASECMSVCLHGALHSPELHSPENPLSSASVNEMRAPPRSHIPESVLAQSWIQVRLTVPSRPANFRSTFSQIPRRYRIKNKLLRVNAYPLLTGTGGSRRLCERTERYYKWV